ncbi:S41 family peptidase [Chlamydiales bacterium]|nr:S41 family peptidase [Chlamydiales bacterium]
MTYLRFIFLFCSCVIFSGLKPPDLKPDTVVKKSKEIMKLHAQYKELNPQVTRRILVNYLEEVDPTKTYFMEEDIQEWVNPSDELLKKITTQYQSGNFSSFYEIHKRFVDSIERRHVIESGIDFTVLPKNIDPQKFKDGPWAKNEAELVDRILEYRSLQGNAINNMSDDLKERTKLRIKKRESKYEEDMSQSDLSFKEPYILSNVLKATAQSLDSHTAYLTPEEATQFMINVQQRLFGIGVQLRDDINGFSVIKIIEGGPAYHNKQLKVKDRIIAVDGEPIVGMDISDGVELIRGEENTSVILTVVRESIHHGEKSEETLDVPIVRGEVVLTESRYKSSYEPYGEGVIANLRLFSFYQDADSSSAKDLTRAFNEIKKDHKVEGVILDLRQNSGGLLSQAVAVTGLFITKGIVVSIKDENGSVQHLRDVEGGTLFDGPLIVLVDRASASASEIVAQTLQDYGRAIIVGDDHTFGKGSFQTFTLDTFHKGGVNPEGEYKVTRGRYYTVSGKTPQLIGVLSDIVVPSLFSESEIGEKYGKYPLDNDWIEPNFNDTLADIPFLHRLKYESMYKYNLQKKLDIYQPYISILRKNSSDRMAQNQDYKNFLVEIKKKNRDDDEEMVPFGQNDLQFKEALEVIKDLIFLSQTQ